MKEDGSFPPSEWNLYEHDGVTTNNFNEGYNNRFNNFLNLKPRPNPYVCAETIKKELLIAEDNSRAADMGNPNLKTSSTRVNQRQQLLNDKKAQMKT